jgi:hypothetical protein
MKKRDRETALADLGAAARMLGKGESGPAVECMLDRAAERLAAAMSGKGAAGRKQALLMGFKLGAASAWSQGKGKAEHERARECLAELAAMLAPKQRKQGRRKG